MWFSENRSPFEIFYLAAHALNIWHDILDFYFYAHIMAFFDFDTFFGEDQSELFIKRTSFDDTHTQTQIEY